MSFSTLQRSLKKLGVAVEIDDFANVRKSGKTRDPPISLDSFEDFIQRNKPEPEGNKEPGRNGNNPLAPIKTNRRGRRPSMLAGMARRASVTLGFGGKKNKRR